MQKICKKTKKVLYMNYRTRILFESLVGLIFHFLLINTLFASWEFRWQSVVFGMVMFILMSEGIFAINQLLERRLTWHEHTLKRLVLLLFGAMAWYLILGHAAIRLKRLVQGEVLMPENLYLASILIYILFITIYVVALIAYNYHRSLSDFKIEIERLKTEKLQCDYRALQDQINPHFLFNNLSTLIAIIRQDQKAAIRFAENFSDVYRYVLKSHKDIAVELKDEMEFIKAYLALHKERMGDGLELIIDIDQKLLSRKVPVLSLQLLVENAIKHNVARSSAPLRVEIIGKPDHIEVKNNLNPKESTYSTNTGLSNLQKRVAFLTERKLVIAHTKDEFRVELPLIG